MDNLLQEERNPSPKTQFDAVARFAERQGKFDFINLYLKLEQLSKVLLKEGKIEEGYEFEMMTESRSTFRFGFFENYTTLYTKDLKDEDGEYKCLLDKSASIRKEYQTLQGYTIAAEQMGFGIGKPYPFSMPKMLEELREGDQITFGSGCSYVCVSRRDVYVDLIPVYSGLLSGASIEKFKNQKKIGVKIDEMHSLQPFYNQVKSYATDNIEMRKININTKAQEIMNRCYSHLSDDKTEILQFGPIKLLAQKDIETKSILWYDQKGKRIEESQVKNLIGWLDTAPVETTVNRKERNIITDYIDEQFLSNVELMHKESHYEQAYEYIKKYCIEHKGSLSINTKSYVKNENGDYEAVSFVFQEKDGKCEVFQVHYMNNDFSDKVDYLSSINEKDYRHFCEKKYDENCCILVNSTMEEFEEKFKKIGRASCRERV